MLPPTFVALICTFDQSGCCCCASAGGPNNTARAIARKVIATTNITTVEINDLFRMCLPQVKRRAFYHSISAHFTRLRRAPFGPWILSRRRQALEAKGRPSATALKEIFTRYAGMWLE